MYLCIYLFIYLRIYIFIYLSAYPSIHVSVHLPIYLSIYLSTYLPTPVSIYPSNYYKTSRCDIVHYCIPSTATLLYKMILCNCYVMHEIIYFEFWVSM